MRYMTLGEMLDAVRMEARISQNPAHGVTLRDPHTYLINRVQDELFINFDWPALKVSQFIDVAEGQRIVAYPAGMSFETLEGIYALDAGGDYRPLVSGIGPDQINEYDPDKVEDRTYPVRRYAHYSVPDEATNHNQFEIWPVPDKATRLYVKGRRLPTKLVNDADKSEIDGPAIVLHVAAELLAAQKAEDAGLKLNKAQERVRALKVRQSAAGSQVTNLGGNRNHARLLRPGIDYIP